MDARPFSIPLRPIAFSAPQSASPPSTSISLTSRTAPPSVTRRQRRLTLEQREAIVEFETGLFTAQVFDTKAGQLTARGANGGPAHLSTVDFHFGINDAVSGDYRTGALFDPNVFRLYQAWDTIDDSGANGSRAEARRTIARGERLFNTKPITITGVKGLNDDFGVPQLHGTCTTCHDTPGAGNHSVPTPLDIGLADAARRRPIYRSTRSGTISRPSKQSLSPIRDARCSPGNGTTSASSRDRSCARSLPARRTFTTARCPILAASSSSTTCASPGPDGGREARPCRIPAHAVALDGGEPDAPRRTVRRARNRP